MKIAHKPLVLFILLFGQALLVFAQKDKFMDPELQQLKANLAAAKHDTTRMMAYVAISYYFGEAQFQYDSALVYAKKAEQIANKYPNSPKILQVLNCLGRAWKMLLASMIKPDSVLKSFYFEQADKNFNKCIKKANQLDNEEYFIRAFFNKNILYSNISNKYRYFKGSLELISHFQNKAKWNSLDSLLLRRTYKNLCINLDYQMGSKKFNEYLAHLKKITPNEGKDYEQLCLLLFEQHALSWDKKDEQKFLEEYQNFKKTFKHIYRINELEQYLALYYFTIQEYEKSFQLMANYSPQNDGNSIEGYRNPGLLTSSGMKYMHMGKNAYMLNRNREAIRYLNKAIRYFNPIVNTVGMENEKYTTLLYLGKAYKKAGKYKEALSCNEQADILYKQMHDVGIQALMAENDVHLEEIKQEKKLHEARTQTLLKEQEIEIQKKQKYAFLAISILALLSAAWAVYSFIKTRKQNQIISQQAAALEESNHLKDKIFALLSHDLRSPINRLVVSLNQSIESQRSTIQLELKSVQDILNNIIHWASMQLKKATPVYANIPLQALADELIDEYYYALEDKSLTFLNNIDSEVRIKTDESYLKIVLRNLISNAIKFTPSNGYIQIACQITPQNVEILLKDTGVGIAAQKIESLFQLPAPTVGTKQEKGTGLGLSLSADIVKKLGGAIQLKSQEGKGTQVVVALPCVA